MVLSAIFAGLVVHDVRSHSQHLIAPPPAHQAAIPVKSAGRLHPLKLRSGLASWYGDLWQGRKTASGELFDTNQLTACHRTLPFGTLVRVINLRNHRSVVVKINDRGTLEPKRVIDLSSAAARRLGMLEAGLVPVRLEIISHAPGSTHS